MMTHISENVSVVILGKMNPAIHHPAWYQQVGILDDTAVELALQPPVLCTPAVSKFSTDRFSLVCDIERWTLQASAQSARAYIAEIAEKTFERLYDTPISAFGLNDSVHISTEHQVGTHIHTLLADSDLGFPNSTCQVRASLKYSVDREVGRYTVSASESDLDPNALLINQNAHFPILGTGSPKHFELTPLLRDGVSKSKGVFDEHVLHLLSILGLER